MTTERNWTPTLSADGIFFCSPACGGGKYCKKADYDLAVSRSNAAAEQLGEGWETHVWENLGWHYKVRKGFVTLHFSHYRDEPTPSIRAWIELPDQPQIIGPSANDPVEALGLATQLARTQISKLEQALAELYEITKH